MKCLTKDSTLVKMIEQAFAADIIESTIFRGELTLLLKKESLLDVCTALKNKENYRMDFLSDVVGVDYLGEDPRFGVIYHLYSIPNKFRVRLKVRLDDGEPIPTVTKIWRSADWAEREIFDLYGIVFTDHYNLKRIYMPDDWEGYPLRKDYPLRGYKDQYNPFGEEKK